MKLNFNYIFAILLLSIIFSCSNNNTENKWIKKSAETAKKQLEKAAEEFKDTQKSPRSIEPNETVRLVKPRDWTSGFFPGSLWYAYELTEDENLKKWAEKYTHDIEEIQYCTTTHDVGFMMYCSYGNGLRLTNNPTYKPILLQTAESLISRFDETVGCIRSWDHHKDVWDYPVIVDNMMNLELLYWAAKNDKENRDKYLNIANTHAKTTMKNHFREDFSSYHVVDYDTLTGKVKGKYTHQGYGDETAWARGQAWGLYGYTVCYRETKNKEFLQMAENIANFIITKIENIDDHIPYWDFNAPDIPNSYKDASAGAIAASALLELSQITKDDKYYKWAETILRMLASDKYLAKVEENLYFILKHSVGNLPNNSEIDTPLNYADYYFLETLKRYIDINNIKIK